MISPRVLLLFVVIAVGLVLLYKALYFILLPKLRKWKFSLNNKYEAYEKRNKV